MNESLRESVSSLCDQPVSELELHRILASMEREDSLRRQWGRHHALGDVLRGESLVHVDTGFADRLRDAIASEPAHGRSLSGRLRASRALRPAASFAVAASVAMAVFVGGQQWQSSRDVAQPAASLAAVPYGPSQGARLASFGSAQPSAVAAPVAMLPDRATLEAEEQRYRSYLLMHAEHAAELQPGGMLPYARLTRYDVGP